MTGLVLPRHVAMQRQKERIDASASSQKRIDVHRFDSDDFVTPKNVAEQLAYLGEYVMKRREVEPDYRLPRPLGWRLQVLVLTLPEETEGGLHMVDSARDQRALASPQGVVLSVGPSAYKDVERFGNAAGELEPWVKVGDRISFVKYDVQVFQIANGQRVGTMVDTQPTAVIDQGWEVPD